MPVHYELGTRPGAEHVALITLDRPEAKNACDLEHFHQLAQAWKRFEADGDAWVAIFTGVGRSFMSGADLKTYVPEITALAKELNAGTATSVKGYSLSDGTDAVLRGTKLYKPIIAAVNGPCVAGGMEMLGGVDIRIAAEHATFGVLEPARGLFAGGGTTVRLPRQIPFAQAMEFLLCADQIDAQRALEMGLLNAVVPEEKLLDKAFEYAARITKNAPLAIQATKRSALEGLKLDMREAYRNEARISKEIFATEDAKEGPRAFAEEAPTTVVRFLMGPDYADARQLCVIGASQQTLRDGNAPEPLVSWEQRAREAAAFAGAEDVLAHIDSLQVVYCQSWPYDDPAGRLAAAIGATPRHLLYSGIGGTTPQDLTNRTAAAMQRGELDLALICSTEALATVRGAKKRGERLPWSHRKSSPFPWEPPHPSELAHEVLQAWETFPLWDTARRAKRGASLADDAAEAASMMAAMSVVAAGNPHAWRPTALDAATVGDPTADNRYVGWPYTKREVAVMDVDMSAAVLLATREKADALGVDEGRRLYLTGWAYAEDPASIAERADMSRSAAMSVVGKSALAHAGVELADIDAFDLYSCFPSSLRLACDALGLAIDDPRGLTITGGLPYAGGPASGYQMHAIATAYDRACERSRPDRVMITGVGMHMAKHVTGIWSSAPQPARPPADPRAVQSEVDAQQPRRELLTTWSGPATVCAYTVAHGRDGAPQQGLVVIDTEDGRALARVHDAALLDDAESRELVGQPVTVTTDGKRNEARW